VDWVEGTVFGFGFPHYADESAGYRRRPKAIGVPRRICEDEWDNGPLGQYHRRA
jgi:hypothetical protein